VRTIQTAFIGFLVMTSHGYFIDRTNRSSTTSCVPTLWSELVKTKCTCGRTTVQYGNNM